MKFSSSVHPFFDLIMIGIPIGMLVLLLVLIVNAFPFNQFEELWPIGVYAFFASMTSLLLLDARFNTYYECHVDHIVLKASWRSETIFYHDIKQVSYPVIGRNSWTNLGLDFKGFMLIYGEGYRVSVTPKESKAFLQLLLEKNPTIKVFKKN